MFAPLRGSSCPATGCGRVLTGMRWFLFVLAWTLLLCVLAARGDSDWFWRLFAEVRFGGLSWALIHELLWIVAAQVLLYVPLGMTCVFASRGRRRRGAGAALAGLALAVAIAVLVAGLHGSMQWRVPGLIALLLPVSGCLVGVVLAGAFGGPASRVLPSLVWRIVALGLVAGVGTGVLVAMALGGATPQVAPATITSEQKRELIEQLRRHHPLKLADGEYTELALSPERLQALLAWGALLVDDDAQVAVRPQADGLAWVASVRLPRRFGGGRHLTLSGDFGLVIASAELRVDQCSLAAGALQLPFWLCRSLVQSAHRQALASRQLAPLVAAIEVLRIDTRGLSVRYGKPAFDEQYQRRLQLALGPGLAIRAAAAAQFEVLRQEGARIAASEDRFGATLQATFGLAERRSIDGDAVAENQGAILALATILGHHEVAILAGIERPADWREIRGVLWPVRLRGRADWTQHFLVSAAITGIATAVVSDAAGLLKEELDAADRSGFSFADLLADRAGTRFGELAGRDQTTARALQRALLQGYRVDDFMPPAADLPEGVSDADLQARFGGVGGPGYQVLIAEIEARVQGLPAL